MLQTLKISSIRGLQFTPFDRQFGVVSSTSDVQSDEPVPTTRAPNVIPVDHDVVYRHHAHHQVGSWYYLSRTGVCYQNTNWMALKTQPYRHLLVDMSQPYFVPMTEHSNISYYTRMSPLLYPISIPRLFIIEPTTFSYPFFSILFPTGYI